MGVSRLLRGDTTEKLHVLFSLYDINNDGKIEIGELIHLIRAKHDDLRVSCDSQVCLYEVGFNCEELTALVLSDDSCLWILLENLSCP